MADLGYLFRVGILVFLVLSLILGGYTGYWETAVDRWRNLRFATQMMLTILFGWPLIGYVTPVLLDLWRIIAQQIVGLGGEFLITDLQTQLLLVVIATLGVQTIIIMMKLKRIEAQI